METVRTRRTLLLGIRPNASRGTRIAREMESIATDQQLRLLFHQLNNQLGVVLAHAELLEAKSPDVTHRARAEQVVKSVLEALGTAKEIRRRSEPLVTA